MISGLTITITLGKHKQIKVTELQMIQLVDCDRQEVVWADAMSFWIYQAKLIEAIC